MSRPRSQNINFHRRGNLVSEVGKESFLEMSVTVPNKHCHILPTLKVSTDPEQNKYASKHRAQENKWTTEQFRYAIIQQETLWNTARYFYHLLGMWLGWGDNK
jgi:hypothetical protein